VADLGAGDEGSTVRNAGGAHGAAHRLCHVLVRLEIGIRARRAEALDRAHDELRIDLVDLFPREAEPLEDAGAEVLHHDVGLLQQVDEHLDRKSTRLNSSHVAISYAVFRLKKK